RSPTPHPAATAPEAGHEAPAAPAPPAATGGRSRGVADAATPLLRLHAEWHAWAPQEGDALRVRRPGRRGVTIHARRQEVDAPRPHVVDADEGVIVAVAQEGDLRSVRRPARIALAPPHLDERRQRIARGGLRVRQDAREEDL